MNVEDLSCGNGPPDPTQPALRKQLASRLGVRQNASIILMAKAGGQNEGVWALEDGARSFVLKLVRNQDSYVLMPTETERFLQLSAQHTTMITDPCLTFPRMIFRLKATVPAGSYDLLVMPRAAGERVSDVIAILWARGQMPQIVSILERAGGFLKDFHIRYGHQQHCDFQPSNVFYDEVSGKFTMVDLADIGSQAISEKDFDHFIGGLRLLSKSFGPQFLQEGQRAFQAGYNSARS